MTYSFPDGFVWGTATAAHQVEGNNIASDFWVLEHTPGTMFQEPSGDACDQLHRYPDDIALLRSLGFGSYRFSIEWARIEPEEGRFSVAALDHYRRVLACCHENGVLPCVTFHHFTSPRWVAADGGWESEVTVDRFLRYCERATAHLGDLIHLGCTLNEANLPVSLALAGVLPRQGLKDLAPFMAEAARRCGTTLEQFGPFLLGDPFKTRDVMLAAHCRARDVIRSGPGDFPVGITLAMQDLVAVPGGEAHLAEARAESFDVFLDAASNDDFVGVQTYSRTRYGPDGPLPPEAETRMNERLFGIHGAALTLRSERMGVIASNIANAATPGYKARDIDFNAALDARLASQRGDPAADPGAGRVWRRPTMPSLDGNTVELNREQVAFAENAVAYSATLSFVTGKVNTITRALKGE